MLHQKALEVLKAVKVGTLMDPNWNWFERLRYRIALVYFKMLYAIPYRKAKANVAYGKYYASTSTYKARLELYGEDITKQMYLKNREWRHYEKMITFKEKLKCFFLPFSHY